jgi:hypothetical protein
MNEEEATAGKTAHFFKLPDYLSKRIESDARYAKIEKTEWFHRASLHFLECSKSGRSFVRDLGYHLIITPCQTNCSKCNKPIEPGTEILYSRMNGAVMCPECYSERYSDKAILNMTLTEIEKKKRLKVLDAFINEKAEVASTYQDKELLHELLAQMLSAQKQEENLRQTEQSYFQTFSTSELSKDLLERLQKDADTFHRRIERISELLTTIEAREKAHLQFQIFKRRKPKFEEEADEQTS